MPTPPPRHPVQQPACRRPCGVACTVHDFCCVPVSCGVRLSRVVLLSSTVHLLDQSRVISPCSPRRRASVILSRFSRNHALCSLTSHTAQPRPVAFTPPSPGKRQARAPTLDSVDPACLVRIRSFDEAVSSRSHPPKARSLPPKPPRASALQAQEDETQAETTPSEEIGLPLDS